MTRPLRFAFFTERMLVGFGVDLAIHHLASGLAHRGHDVSVWTVFSESPDSLPYRIRRFPVGTTVFLPWYDRTVLRRLGQIPETTDADVFVVTHPMGAVLRVRRPSIFIDFGVAPRFGLGFRERLNEIYARSLHYSVFISHASSVLVPSRFLRDSLPPYLRRKAREFRLGADHYPDPDPRGVSEVRASFGTKKPITLYVGRLTHRRQPYKGVRTLLQMFRVVQNHTHLVLAGLGSDEDRKTAAEFGASVILSPPPQMMPVLFGAADIFATASRWEGVDLPLLEALRFGKPVLAFDIPVHREWVRHGVNGFLARNPGEFTSLWERLAREESLRMQIAAQAAESVASFKWDAAVKTLEDLAGALAHRLNSLAAPSVRK